MESPTKIIVLGGSFNPPTLAHKKLMKCAMECTHARIGIFVPSSDNYVSRKMSRQRTYNTVYSETNRKIMLEHLCNDTSHTMTVSIVEYGDDGRGHTYDTLCKIQAAYPNAEIIFVLGTDKLRILPKWHHNDTLLKQFSFLVACRSDTTKADIKRTINSIPKLAAHSEKFYIMPMSQDAAEVSSSKARQLIAKNKWQDVKDILADATIEYLKQVHA